MERVLVAYGSKYGATAEIAEAIGRALEAKGLDVDVRRARSVRSLQKYGAAVVGSAVYAGHWRGDALRLLADHRDWLDRHDVWLFSSGPVGEDDELDDEAETERWTKPKQVRQLASEIGVRDHVVFGGMVAEDRGFIRKRMARNMPEASRDRRNWAEIATEAGADVEEVEGFAQAAELLRAGRVDATINDRLTYLDYVQSQGGETGLVDVAETEETSENALAFRAGSESLVTAVDEALATLAEDGTLAEISERYFGEDVSQP